MTDVTKSNHLFASLEEIKRFAASVAHEADNSLAAIIATAQLLRASAHDPAATVRLATRIEAIASQMSEAMIDLKVLGTPPRRDSLRSLNDLVAEAAERLSPIAQQYGVSVDLRLDPTLPPMICDHRGVQRVCINLIKNALEAVRGVSTRPVIVKTRKVGSLVALSVYNRGTPIPKELQDRMFEPFFSTKPQGSGLGLVITKEIVVAGHGGELRFRSGPTLGTVFCAKFPLGERVK